jgi:hypothetical protein
MRATVVTLVLALIIGACSSGEEPAPTSTKASEPGPRDVVSGWIDAVIASDAETLAELVEPGGLVILAAIENGFSEEEVAVLLDGGVPFDLIDKYWTSFRGGFADFAGVPLQSIEVGGHDEFMLGEIPFASVVITSGDGVTSVMASRRLGEWRLDLIGSFGPAFAAQLRRMLVNLSESPAGERIRDAYRSDVVPGLLAALRRAPGNRVLGAELERMALLLET